MVLKKAISLHQLKVTPQHGKGHGYNLIVFKSNNPPMLL